MKISFVYMGAENLGVEYLVASLRAAGHDVELLFDPSVFGGHMMWNVPAFSRMFDLRERIVARIVGGGSEVVAFSCFSANYQWALQIARDIKARRPEVKTLFGGVHPTMAPRRVISVDCVDALITGEAEESIVKLMRRWETGDSADIPGLWIKEDGDIKEWRGAHPLADVHRLPYPAKKDFYEKVPQLAGQYTVLASRGCPYDCAYCNSSRYSRSAREARGDAGSEKSPNVRRRNAADIVAELETAVDRRKAGMVVFRDDVFPVYNRKWFDEFRELYATKIGMPYYCWLYPTLVDGDAARVLGESGCGFVSLGMQSVEEETRKKIMGRSYSNDVVRSAVSALKKNGISVSLDHIVGFPGDDEAVLRRAVNFYNELRPDRLQVYSLVYLPGTEIFDSMKKEGSITKEDAEGIENGNVDFLFSSRSRSTTKNFSRFMFLLAATTILPRKWVDFLMSAKAMNFVPSSTSAKNLLVFLSAVRLRDPMFKYHFGFIFAKKKVP